MADTHPSPAPSQIYEPPELELIGSLEDLTLGGTVRGSPDDFHNS